MLGQPPAPLQPCPRGPDLVTVLLPGRKSEHKYVICNLKIGYFHGCCLQRCEAVQEV